jgi:hypothetical protein
MSEKETEDKAKAIVSAGSEIAGAAVGGALGFFAGGPVVAAGAGVFGVIVSRSVRKILGDYANRYLSKREEARIGATAAYALVRLRERLERGDNLRDDNFFKLDSSGRSPAHEILEGVLQKARNEHQEKKLKYLGNLFANLAFRKDVSPDAANLLLKTAEDMTYRQFYFLYLVHKHREINVQALRRPTHQILELELLKREEMSLHAIDLGTIGLLGGTGRWNDKLSDIGRLFFDLLDLSEIPEDDMSAVERLLHMCTQETG